MTNAPLIVIAGPTASGKTALAVTLAEQCGGEIICADSRTIYREATIGTAKPSLEDQARVPHWGIDLINPDQSYSAAEFKRYADAKITEIRARNAVPFLVGGTGLYIDAVVLDYQFGAKPNSQLRAQLETMTIEALHDHCVKNNIALPENAHNKRYVIRAIEQHDRPAIEKNELIDKCFIVGITTDKAQLRTRMQARTEQLFQHGVVEEAKLLGKKYSWTAPALSGNIYRLVHSYLLGDMTLVEITAKNTTLDWQLAKRQLTWLRRNDFVTWYSLAEAEQSIAQHLASYRQA